MQIKKNIEIHFMIFLIYIKKKCPLCALLLDSFNGVMVDIVYNQI